MALIEQLGNEKGVLIGTGVGLLALWGMKQLLFGDGGDYKKLLEFQKQMQTIEIGTAKEGEGAPRRSARYPEILEQYDPEVKTLYQMWNKTVAAYGDRPFLGTRHKVNDKVGPYEWETYSQAAKRRDNLGSAIVNLGHQTDEPIGIYAINRAEWIITDAACQAFRWPSVALYDTLGQNAVEFIVNHAVIKLVVCAGKQVSTMLKVAKNVNHLKTIISMDPIDDKLLQEANSLGVKLLFMKDVEAEGAKNPREHVPPSAQDIYTIMYTSGTTGDPKGVILTHGNLIAEMTGVRNHEKNLFSSEDVHMSYLPLAHSFERAVVFTMIAYGAKIGFFQGNINELFNDIAELRPTFLVGAPRVWSRLHDKLLLTINNGSGIKKNLFHWGYAAKQAALKKGKSTPFWDKLLFSKTKARLGGRVRFILSGSAPLDPQLGEFLRICFCCDVVEGYGLTENAAGACITYLQDRKLGHVGTPLCCTEIKLVDVPEMGYSSKNNPPTGEVMLRGGNVFKGYFKDPEKTKEALEPDGWFHTGDIGKWNENGTLSIIDRKKNIFKLSQGEYVAVEYLEGIYKRCSLVLQVWVYGSSYKRFLVCVVVPDPETFVPWAKSKGFEGELADLCKNEKAKEALLAELTAVGTAAQLKGFEFVKAVHLTPDQFTVDNDFITPTFKLRRNNLLKFYQPQIDEMYAKIGD